MSHFNQYNDAFYTDIPLIQRDYVQGADRNAQKRDTFIYAIFNCLAGLTDENGNKYSGKLDFVYGTSSDPSSASKRGGFLPIDGQQRLTTLSLIGWLLAQRTDPQRHKMPKLSYRTRHTTEQFCNHLFDYNLPAGFTGDIREHLRTEPMWMSERWLDDPSINAMLDLISAADTILKSDIYNGKIGAMANTFFNSSPLEFEMLDMKNYGLTEDLYVKMNARGKHLSAFENWKAEFTGMLKAKYDNVNYAARKVGDKTLTVPEYFSYAIEHEWTYLLWPDAFAEWNSKTAEEKRECSYPRIDEQFMTLFDFITRSLFFEQYPCSASRSKNPSPQETEAVDPAKRFEGDNGKWLPARRIDMYRPDPNAPGKKDNIFILFGFFDTLCDIAKGGWSTFFEQLLVSGPWDSQTNKVNLFDDNKNVNLFDRCLRGELRMELAALLRGIIYYCNYFGVAAANDELRNFIRVFRGWIQTRRQRLAAKVVGIRDNFRVDDYPTMIAVLEKLTVDRDVYQSLDKLKEEFDAGDGVKDVYDQLAREIEKAELRKNISADVIDHLAGCEYLKGDFSNIVDSIRAMASQPRVMFDRFVKFYTMSDHDKAVALLQHGWHGEKVQQNCYRFYGKRDHWDYVFTTSGQSFRKAITGYLCDTDHAALSPLTKEYYLEKYKDFYDAHRWDESPSHFYYIVSDFEKTTLLSRFTCRLPVYQQCPYAYALVAKLKRENPTLCENLSLKDSYEASAHGAARMLGDKCWIECVPDGWRFDLSDGYALASRFEIGANGCWHDKLGEFSFTLDTNGYNVLADVPGKDRIESAAAFLSAL